MDDSPVRELYASSGMEKELGQLSSLIQALFDQSVAEDGQARKLPKDVVSAVRASVPEAFAPEKLKEAMLAELTEKLTAQDIKEVLEWLDSPIGKKFTQLEEAASTPEAQAEMQQYASRRSLTRDGKNQAGSRGHSEIADAYFPFVHIQKPDGG